MLGPGTRARAHPVVSADCQWARVAYEGRCSQGTATNFFKLPDPGAAARPRRPPPPRVGPRPVAGGNGPRPSESTCGSESVIVMASGPVPGELTSLESA